ncbi:MAG: uroporphyrinogen decarboxylase [Pseudomonadota bacterium]
MNPRERFLAACSCQTGDRPPVWLMRQAGRYLPEYCEIREKYSFVEMCRSPGLAVEISLQPWRRFRMDAVIFFSDILIPAQAMGMRLDFEEGKGPVLDRKITSASDIDSLSSPHIRRTLSFSLETIAALKAEVGDEAAILGFVGAPWTIACYMIEGGSGDFSSAVSMAQANRKLLNHLLDRITGTITEYAVEQVRAGADCVQIFDTWAGILDAELYMELAVPRIRGICEAVSKAGGVPILFIKDSEKLLDAMNESGAQVLSVGPRTDLTKAWQIFGKEKATQGNLDPEILLGSPASVVAATLKLLETVKDRPGHIVNLGHGVQQKTKPECVKAMVDTVKASNS